MNKLLRTLFFILTALATGAAHGAGFQHEYVADADGRPLEVGIWYPSRTAAKPVTMGPTTMTVALNGTVDGSALHSIVMSHGTGGSFLSHFDTAIALADAGFVVAAVTHTGDNYADQSRSLLIMDRPRQISRVIDHLLSTWDGHAAIDPTRVGMFGFSAGGFTTLVAIGGIADFSKIGPMCREHPTEFSCQLIAKAGTASVVSLDFGSSSGSAHDLRIKAAVVAAPALGFTFSRVGLQNVKVPVQLWRAEFDTILPHPRSAEAVALGLSGALDYRVVPLAGHFDFLAPCSDALAEMVPVICRSASGFDRAAFHRTFNAAVVDYFGRTLH